MSEAMTTLVQEFMTKYGQVSTDYDSKDVIPFQKGKLLVYMKTARAGMIVIEVDTKYSQDGETIATKITINAPKI